MKWLMVLLVANAGAALADTVVSTHVIRVGTLIAAGDLKTTPVEVDGTFQSIDEIAGLEARSVIYPGRPIKFEAAGEPALVNRNQLISLKYIVGGLTIFTEGRAMARAGAGETVGALNLTSRATVTGIVQPDGSVQVGR